LTGFSITIAGGRHMTEHRRSMPEDDLFRKLSGMRDLSGVCQAIAQAAMEITTADLGVVLLVDRHLVELRIIGAAGLASPRIGFRLPIAQQMGIVNLARIEKRSILVSDVKRPEQEWVAWYRPLLGAIRCELCVPVIAEGETRVLGLIDVESQSADHFDSSHEARLATLAGHVANAIRLVEGYRRLRALGSLGRELVKSESLTEGLRRVLAVAVEHTGAVSGSARVYDEASGRLFPLVRVGETTARSAESIAVGEGVVGAVFETGAYQLHSDVSKLAKGQYLPFNSRTRSELAVPIMGDGGSLGVINLEHPEVDNFDSGDAEFVMDLAGFASVLLAGDRKSRSQAQVEVVAATTGIAQMLAHPVRSSLAGIASKLLEVERLMDQDTGVSDVLERVRRVREIAGSQGDRLGRIFEVLSFHIEEHELNDIVVEAVQTARHDGVGEVDVDVQQGPGGMIVRVDRDSIKAILETLVTNSLEAIEKTKRGGHVRIRVELADRSARVIVADDGPGVRADIQKDLFTIEASTKRTAADPHRGLGLLLSHKLAALNGCVLSLGAPAENVGAIFVLQLPVIAILETAKE